MGRHGDGALGRHGDTAMGRHGDAATGRGDCHEVAKQNSPALALGWRVKRDRPERAAERSGFAWLISPHVNVQNLGS